MNLPIPLPQFLGLILGEIASVGPKTSLELFERLNGRGVSADEEVGLHALTLPLIQWACGQLEKRGCAMLTGYGWRFVAWPKTGTFGHVDSPTEQLAAAVSASEGRVCKVAASELVGADKPPAPKPAASGPAPDKPTTYRSPPLRRQRAAEPAAPPQAVAAVVTAPPAPPPTQAKPKAVVLDDPPPRRALKQASFF